MNYRQVPRLQNIDHETPSLSMAPWRVRPSRASRRPMKASTQRWPSMRIARDFGAAAADKKVQIGAQMRLLHMLDVEFVPSALGCRRRTPLAFAACELFIRYVQMQAASGHVELDDVAVAHQRQRTTLRGLRRGMQYHRAVGGSAHPRIGH